MRFKLIIDMNLSPKLVSELAKFGIEATHWSQIGPHDAPDVQILLWAKENSCVVLTHDLDFGAILASTGLEAPSVIQIRTLDVRPERIAVKVARLLEEFEERISTGALVILDEEKSRVRLLPLNT